MADLCISFDCFFKFPIGVKIVALFLQFRSNSLGLLLCAKRHQPRICTLCWMAYQCSSGLRCAFGYFCGTREIGVGEEYSQQQGVPHTVHQWQWAVLLPLSSPQPPPPQQQRNEAEARDTGPHLLRLQAACLPQPVTRTAEPQEKDRAMSFRTWDRTYFDPQWSCTHCCDDTCYSSTGTGLATALVSHQTQSANPWLMALCT